MAISRAQALWNYVKGQAAQDGIVPVAAVEARVKQQLDATQADLGQARADVQKAQLDATANKADLQTLVAQVAALTARVQALERKAGPPNA